jgi:hypothetical protein
MAHGERYAEIWLPLPQMRRKTTDGTDGTDGQDVDLGVH